MLHLISSSPLSLAVLERIEKGAVVVFMDNAVLWLLKTGNMKRELATMAKANCLYALAPDLLVRGIEAHEIVEDIQIIDYDRLVELAAAHPLIQSWN